MVNFTKMNYVNQGLLIIVVPPCTCVCLQGYYYANGVALSPDETYVVMAETDTISAHKIWVKGPKVITLPTHPISHPATL